MSFLDKLFGREVPDVQALQADVAVSDLFTVWCQSDIGRYIIGRAEQYEVQVLKDLAGVSPTDTTRIIELQKESMIPGKILEWIEEAIERGEVARFQLSEIEE